MKSITKILNLIQLIIILKNQKKHKFELPNLLCRMNFHNRRFLLIKNMTSPNEKKIYEYFGRFGKIFSVNLTGSNDSVKRDVVIEYEREEVAQLAKNTMNNKVIEGNTMFVDFAIGNHFHLI